MKGISNISKMFLLSCFIGLTLYAIPIPPPPVYINAAGSTVNDTLIIPYVEVKPTIDGVEEGYFWKRFPNIGLFAFTDSTPGDSPEDLSGYYKVAWGDYWLCLFVHVVDDTIVTNHTDSWRNDCIEIFIDGGCEKTGSYDSNDVQWRACALEDTLALCWNNGTNLRPLTYELAWMENADGYNMELAIPDTSLIKQGYDPVIFDLIPGTVIGFEIQASDNDSTSSDRGLRWWSDAGEPSTNPSVMGTAILGGYSESTVLGISRIGDNGPAIDGILDTVWTNNYVPEVSMSVYADGGYPEGGQPDFSTWFRIACNKYCLYLFGRAVDDSIAMGYADWNSDCWEIYIDGGNEKTNFYDNNDVHYRFVFGQDSATQGPGPSECDVAWVQTADGYTWELSIPHTTLIDTNIKFTQYDQVGFEVQATDNDGNPVGDGREGTLKWWSSNNDSYLDPSLFGVAIVPVSEVPEKISGNISLITPPILTLATDITYTIPARSSVRISILNILGQMVSVPVNGTQSAGTYTASLGDGLANGIYLIKLDACNQSVGKKSLMLK